MKKNKKTKIVATIGPASVSVSKLKSMVEAGMNVCRLNFSHGDYAWHRSAIRNIRKVESELDVRIGILADLQGPRIRVVNETSVVLKDGEKVFLTDQKKFAKSRRKRKIAFDWENFFVYVKEGDDVFIEDGLIRLRVVELLPDGCLAQVVVAGEVKPHKAVNIPRISSRMDFLTEKDLSDLEFALGQGVDMIAASFVGSEKDVMLLRQTIDVFLKEKHLAPKECRNDYAPWVISKIERRSAIRNLKKILKASDGVMVARGDLGIEMPQEKVALLELDILRQARRLKRPVIVATQMLASMENSARPTRAEISDVTTAVVNHTDAVMLSGESAMGKYPVQTVQIMADIIREAEASSYDNLPLRKNKFWRMILGKDGKYKSRVKTANDLKELLFFSAQRPERVKLRLSKKKICDWGKATLLWGVITDGFQ